MQETEKAILLEFGNIVDADITPGLHFKMPIAEEVKKFDARVLTVDASPETYYTLEKKPLIVDSFVKWRVADNELFYKGTSFDERRAQRLLQERVNEGLRNQISKREMFEVISGERDQLMDDLRQDLDRVMRESVGVEVIDVRVKKIDLPAEVSSTVYERMNSERDIEARQYRQRVRNKRWLSAQRRTATRWCLKLKPTARASSCEEMAMQAAEHMRWHTIRTRNSMSFIAA